MCNAIYSAIFPINKIEVTSPNTNTFLSMIFMSNPVQVVKTQY